MLKRLAALLALALLGAAEQPAVPAVYAPFIGTWNCTRPAPAKLGWTGTFTVAPTDKGTLEFT